MIGPDGRARWSCFSLFAPRLLLISLACIVSGQSFLDAQERVTPRQVKGGQKQGQPWAEVPESFRNLKVPAWPVPSDLKTWQTKGRKKVRQTLLECLGEMPTRPDPSKVRIVSREDKGDYILERIDFHNGVDMVVPGILLVPKDRSSPRPAIIALHGHGSSKESVCADSKNSHLVGPPLAKKDYVVAAIDAAFGGERVGKGSAGRLDDTAGQEFDHKRDREEFILCQRWSPCCLWRALGGEPATVRPGVGQAGSGHQAHGGRTALAADSVGHGLDGRSAAGQSRRTAHLSVGHRRRSPGTLLRLRRRAPGGPFVRSDGHSARHDQLRARRRQFVQGASGQRRGR